MTWRKVLMREAISKKSGSVKESEKKEVTAQIKCVTLELSHHTTRYSVIITLSTRGTFSPLTIPNKIVSSSSSALDQSSLSSRSSVAILCSEFYGENFGEAVKHPSNS